MNTRNALKYASAAIAIIALAALIYESLPGGLPATPAHAQTTLTVQRSADRTSATATWTPNQGAQVQAFAIVAKLLPGEPDTTGHGVKADTFRYVDWPLAGDVGSLHISPLDPARAYMYAVTSASQDSDGNWVWTDWQIVHDDAPPPDRAAADRAALVAIYNATDGPNWTNNANWLTDKPLAEWRGVTTDDNGRVTMLDLLGNRLSGSIPSELANLSELKTLELGSDVFPFSADNNMMSSGNHNLLSGPIPPELGNLANLTYLGLSGNQLSGSVPPELANLTNLTWLGLQFNHLSGPIPPELGDLTNLTYLGLFGNQLSGPIPPELGDLTNLVWLYLYNNRLSGPIPPELGDLANLADLSLSVNRLSGPIPPELGNLTNLAGLKLQNNSLSGNIPSELGNLSKLKTLELGSEQLPGLGNYNHLSGPIPPELGNLTNLDRLYLHNNRLSGPIPSKFGNLTILRQLRLNNNRLSGSIPPELGNLTSLQALHLSGNQLTGPIPSQLGSLSNLQELSLAGNQLTGCVPHAFLWVYSNDFYQLNLPFCAPTPASTNDDRAALTAFYNATNGPDWTDNANWLTDKPLQDWFGVYINAVHGGTTSIDTEDRVSSLELWHNGLTGTIPPEIGNLSGLRELSLGYNDLTGPIPPEIGNLANLTYLYLGDNQLEGSIPPEIGNLSKLDRLFLNNNRLTGCIPNALLNVQSRDFAQLGLPFCSPVASHPTDRAALNALYAATDGQNWDNNANWGDDDKPLALWRGVTTDGGGRVTRLSLDYNRLSGPIPSELGDLYKLREIYLAGNQLTGCIPNALRDVKSNDFADLNLPFCPP